MTTTNRLDLTRSTPNPTEEPTVKPFDFLKRHERFALAAAAVAAALAGFAAALMPFAVDGSAPFFASDAASLAAVERCRPMPARASRHACLREVAAARAAAAEQAVARAD
jgi:hypothetical protein